jgi:uncharacterized OB-fold protein
VTGPNPDRDSAPWWAALAEHRLTLQRCAGCATLRWAPRAMCNACGSFEWCWVGASGAGTVATWTVVHRTPVHDLATPYVVVLARLAEAPNLLVPGGWAGAAEGTDIRTGLEVRAGYRDLDTPAGTDAAALLCWGPAAASRASACVGDVHT